MIHVVADGIMYSFGVFFVYFLTYFQESKSVTSWIISIMVGLSALLGPVSSALTNKFGCRVVIIIGTIISFFGLFLSFFATNIIYLFIFIGIFTGTGLGLITVPVIIVVACYFDKKRSLANGIAMSGSGIGTLVMAPFLTFLIKQYEWQGALLITSAIMLNCCVFSMLFKSSGSLTYIQTIEQKTGVILKREIRGECHNIEIARGVEDNSQKNKTKLEISKAFHLQANSFPYIPVSKISELPRKSISEPNKTTIRSPTEPGLLYYKDIFYCSSITSFERNMVQQSNSAVSAEEITDTCFSMLKLPLLKDYNFVLCCFSYSLYFISSNIPYVYSVNKVIEENLSSEEKASYLLSILGIFNTIARIFSGYMSKVMGISNMTITIICFVICGIATILCVFMNKYYQVAIYCAIYGMSSGIIVTLQTIILVELFDMENLTSALGLSLIFIGIASVIGAPINGAFYELNKSGSIAFYFSGTAMIMGGLIIFLLFFKKKDKK